MKRAFEKGTVAYFSFDTLSIHGAVIKQGVFKKRASIQLAQGAYMDGRIRNEDAFDLAFDELCRMLKVRKGMACAVDIEGTQVLSRKVNVPSTISKQEMRGYLFMEIGNSIILPFEDVSFDFEIVKEDEVKTEVMLHAVAVEVTDAIRAYMRKRGLVLQKIVPRPIAVARGVSLLQEIKSDNVTLLWHVTPNVQELVMLEQGKVAFIRSIETKVPFRTSSENGTVRYTYAGTGREWAAQLEDWLTELVRFIDFYRYSLRSDGKSADQLFVSGTVPGIPELVRLIEAEAIVPVKAVDTSSAGESKDDAHWVPLLGMALAIDTERDINFIGRNDIVPRWPLAAGLGALLIGGGLSGFLYYQTTVVDEKIAQVNDQIELAEVYREEQANSKAQQVSTLRTTVTELEKIGKDAVPALKALTEQLPPTGYVLDYNYADASALGVNVQFETIADLNEFQRSLLNDARFANVKLLNIESAEQDEENKGSEDNEADDEVLPRYIGEFTFTFVPETQNGEEKKEVAAK